MDVETHAPFTKSPLDPWRGTGQVAKRIGLPVPIIPANRLITTGLPETATDIAGNVVKLDHDYIKHVATIKTATTVKPKREPSPCPCKSKECNDEYEKMVETHDGH